jgi:hypothetical protein
MKMSEESLLSFLEAEQDSSFQHASGTLSSEREQALRDYQRMPYGNEEEGRASSVSSDVFDQVEAMLPDLVDVFVSTDKAVVFDPVGPEDEQGAKQATDACNYVFYKQNPGFLILYAAAKDALLLKTGGVKWWWDERRTVSFSTHTADEMQLAMHLVSNPDIEVVEQEKLEPDQQQMQQRQQAEMMAAQQGMQLPPEPRRLRVKLKKVETKGKVCIAPIPPDELYVSTRHTSVMMDDCPYVAHVCRRTMSDIKQMGFNVTVDDVRAAKDENTTGDRDFREYDNELNEQDDNDLDESMIRGWLREEYVLVDFDGDGIAERRRVVRLGKKLLENVECSHVPFAAWTPYILTHRFHGMSVADLVTDVQKISTDILRGQLDNLSLANNQETVVLTDSQGNPQADLDDLLNRRPGGVLRERVPNAIRPYNERWQGIEAMPMIEQVSRMKQNRTGHIPFTSSLDADALNKTATQTTKESNAVQKRMKMMARIMAEALVAPMFRGIFKTLLDYNMEPLSFRLNGSFVQVDPQEWRDGYDMTINVGIGTGDTMEQMAYLTQIAQAQFAAMQTPFGGRVVTEQNFYACQARLAEKAGFKNPGEFWTDPSKLPPPQPPPPDPKIALEQQKLQASAQEAQLQRQDDQQRFQAEAQMQMAVDKNRQEMEARQKQLELRQEGQLEALRAQYEARQEASRLAFERWKVELTESVKLQIAGQNSIDKRAQINANLMDSERSRYAGQADKAQDRDFQREQRATDEPN